MPAPTLRMDGGAVRLYRSSAGAVRDAGPYAADGWGCRAAAGASPRPTGSERMGPSGGFRRVPAAGHTGPALRDHTNPLPAGLRGLWPSYFGAMLLGVSSRRVRSDLTAKGGSLFVDYAVEIEHVPVGTNTYEITVWEP